MTSLDEGLSQPAPGASAHLGLVKGKRVTGFSWPEEELAHRAQAVPYNLQEELKKRGARYSTAGKPFEPYVVEDDRLITGQNPASARAVAEAVVERLSAG